MTILVCISKNLNTVIFFPGRLKFISKENPSGYHEFILIIYHGDLYGE